MAGINRALIIDDDEINNFICIKNMQDIGFAKYASQCLHGAEALEEIDAALADRPEDLPDVIFLDINMPKMNAWEFLEAYKARKARFPKDVHLFILSSSVYRKDIKRSSRFEEVKEYIIKPLKKEDLRLIKDKYFSGDDHAPSGT